MTRKKENNFSTATKQKIRDMAGSMCSFPDCRRSTTGAKSDRSTKFGVGVACHIKAASPNGPRYDPAQTTEDRSNFSNGLWMCQTHSVLIDADDSAYSVETLNEWQRISHERATKFVNTRLLTQEESDRNASTHAMRSLRDFIKSDEDILTRPLTNYVSGYSEALSDLDPRFNIDVTASQNHIMHVIRPLSHSVPLKFEINSDGLHQDTLKKYQDLIESGTPVEFNSDDVQITGSPLLDHVQAIARKNRGSVKLSGQTSIMDTQISVHNASSEVTLYTLESTMTAGLKKIIMSGVTSDGVFRVNAVVSQVNYDTSVNLNFSFESWIGKDINKLPYFARHKKAANLLKDGSFKVIYTPSEGGIELPFDFGISADGRVISSTYANSVLAISDIQEFANKINIKPLTIHTFENLSSAEESIAKFTPLLSGPKTYKQSPEKRLGGGTIIFDDNFLKRWAAAQEKYRVTITKPSDCIDLLGNLLQPPPIRFSFENVDIVLFCSLNSDDTCFELHTNEDTVCAIEIMNNSPWTVA